MISRGHLHYKMIKVCRNRQSVPFEAHIKNLFTFSGIQIFVFLTIRDAMMSIKHERGYIFENIC